MKGQRRKTNDSETIFDILQNAKLINNDFKKHEVFLHNQTEKLSKDEYFAQKKS